MNRTPSAEAPLHEKAITLRSLMREYGDWEPLLDDIMQKRDPASISELLSIVDFPELPHQTFAIIHAVESFPTPVYLREFVKALEAMANNSREFFDLVLMRVLNNAEDLKALPVVLMEHASERGKALATEALQRIQREDERFSQRCDAVLKELRQS
jgi:hypothetical protein